MLCECASPRPLHPVSHGHEVTALRERSVDGENENEPSKIEFHKSFPLGGVLRCQEATREEESRDSGKYETERELDRMNDHIGLSNTHRNDSGEPNQPGMSLPQHRSDPR